MALEKYNQKLRCADCIHSSGTLLTKLTKFQFGMKCGIPEATVADQWDPVFGKLSKGYQKACTTMRLDDACGPDAAAWQPRSKKHLFLAFHKSQVDN